MTVETTTVDGDALLLERARGGDRRALEELLGRHQRRVYRFGLSMCRDSEDARDVVQDTLLAVARSIQDFRGASSVSTWLYTIARSFCIKKRRRSIHAPASEVSIDEKDGLTAVRGVADPSRTPDEVLAGRQVEAALETAIARLPPMYREVLILRDVEGLTAPEVAEIVGIGVEAVKSRLHRARAAVRAEVAPLLAEPETSSAPGCPDIVALFSSHLEGDIDGTVCAEMERHLEGCPGCRARCDGLRTVLARCRSSPLPDVPAEIQADVRRALSQLVPGARTGPA
jgi:RNA polymerase sigma-70 factor (ECF subfamily)